MLLTCAGAGGGWLAEKKGMNVSRYWLFKVFLKMK